MRYLILFTLILGCASSRIQHSVSINGSNVSGIAVAMPKNVKSALDDIDKFCDNGYTILSKDTRLIDAINFERTRRISLVEKKKAVFISFRCK